MKKRMTIMIIALTVVFGGIIGFNVFKQYMIKQYFKTFKMPAVTISTTIAKKMPWQPTINGVGNFSAVNGVDVNAQQSGHITNIQFKSGEHVEKGQLLLELDHRIEDANLADAKASLLLAKTDYQRQLALLKKSATAESTVDSAKAKLQQAQAAVDKIQTIIAQKKITAPFSGKLGVRLVNLGQYVTPGSTPLVSLQSLDPLYLQFYLPEQNLKSLYPGQEIIFNIESYPNHYFKGTIEALNSKVDPNTHNILIQAKVENCPRLTGDNIDEKLFNPVKEQTTGITIFNCQSALNKKSNITSFTFMPGMFAELSVILPDAPNVLVLPRTAISYSLYGNSVYIVKKVKDDKTQQQSLKVFQKFVKTGDERGTKVVVLSGIKEGDEVVNSGQLKLQNGVDVKINNDVKLTTAKNIDELGQ